VDYSLEEEALTSALSLYRVSLHSQEMFHFFNIPSIPSSVRDDILADISERVDGGELLSMGVYYSGKFAPSQTGISVKSGRGGISVEPSGENIPLSVLLPNVPSDIKRKISQLLSRVTSLSDEKIDGVIERIVENSYSSDGLRGVFNELMESSLISNAKLREVFMVILSLVGLPSKNSVKESASRYLALLKILRDL